MISSKYVDKRSHHKEKDDYYYEEEASEPEEDFDDRYHDDRDRDYDDRDRGGGGGGKLGFNPADYGLVTLDELQVSKYQSLLLQQLSCHLLHLNSIGTQTPAQPPGCVGRDRLCE